MQNQNTAAYLMFGKGLFLIDEASVSTHSKTTLPVFLYEDTDPIDEGGALIT